MESKTKRIGRLIKTIGNQPGITLARLCEFLHQKGLNVSPRTVAKDILSLKKDYDLLPAQGRLRRGYQLADLFTIGDTELGVVADALSAFAINLDDNEARQVADRILAFIAGTGERSLHERVGKRLLGQKVIVDAQQPYHTLDPLIMSAIRQRLSLRLKYQSPRTRGPLTLTCFPLFKVFYERAWYLVVREQKEAAFYPCRLDRIAQATIVTSVHNDNYPNDLADARYLMSCGWGMTFPNSRKQLKDLQKQPDIVVRFDSTVAPYILEGQRRHPFARVQRARDGSGDVIFTIKLLDNWEFKHWVRSFGSAARFVAPARLVDEERADVRRLAERYGLKSL